jgi:hypothetical protein
MARLERHHGPAPTSDPPLSSPRHPLQLRQGQLVRYRAACARNYHELLMAQPKTVVSCGQFGMERPTASVRVAWLQMHRRQYGPCCEVAREVAGKPCGHGGRHVHLLVSGPNPLVVATRNMAPVPAGQAQVVCLQGSPRRHAQSRARAGQLHLALLPPRLRLPAQKSLDRAVDVHAAECCVDVHSWCGWVDDVL